VGTTNATFLSTSDEGATFSDSPIIAGDSMESLTCVSNLSCTAIGWNNAFGPNDLDAGLAAVTSDGGKTWTAGTLPLGLGVDYETKVSCSDAEHCSMLGEVEIPQQYLTQCPVNPAIPSAAPQDAAVQAYAQAEARAAMAEKQTFSCPTSGNNPVVYQAIASTQDGGVSWSVDSLPAGLPQPFFLGISCSTATQCWVTGEAALPQQVGASYDEGSSILLGTNDGGATWSNVTYNGQAYLSLASIACPSAVTCVALGVGPQNASSVPTYTLVS
jgi:photosystem II stability/assembly factor-like uncharacterized protein